MIDIIELNRGRIANLLARLQFNGHQCVADRLELGFM